MKKIIQNKKGSMMITVVALGMILSILFFGIAEQMMSNRNLQEKTAERQSKQKYLESYAGYIEHLSRAQLESLNNINSGEISGELERAENTEGFLDAGESAIVNAEAGQNVTVLWNSCAYSESGKIIINGILTDETSPDCAEGAEYASGVVITADSGGVRLQSAGPAHYRIPDVHPVNKWHLKLRIPMAYGEDMELEREFEGRL